MKIKILVFVLFFSITVDIYAQEFKDSQSFQADSTKSKYSVIGRIAVETATGTGVSILTLILLLPDTNILSAYLLSEVFGISAALVLGEYVFDDNGNISKAIGGGLIGMISSILFVALTNDNDSKNIAKGVVFFGFPTFGASIGYNLDEITGNRSSLLQYSNSNKTKFGIPDIYTIHNRTINPQMTTYVRIFQFSF